MHALRSSGLVLVGLLAAAAPASAQVPVPTPPPASPPAQSAPAAAGKLRMVVKHVSKMDGKVIGVRGDKVTVKGRLKPAVKGQRIQVRMRSRGGKVTVRKAAVKRNGRFSAPVRLKERGRVSITAVHKASGQIAKAESRKAKLRVYEPDLHLGSDGALAALFNRELRQLKYPAPHSKTFDAATGRAVLTYRKVNDLERVEMTTAGIVRNVIRGKGGYKVRYPDLGKHVEADLGKQIIALVDGDELHRVYHISSGAPATPTVVGTYHFYLKTPGTNAKGMVDSNYFIRGYAIHGYYTVPTYNASHGCLRVPIPDAAAIYDWIEIGDAIRVTY